MPYDQLVPDGRAAVIVNLARRLGLSDTDIITVTQDAVDGTDVLWPLPGLRPDAARHILRLALRASFCGDDDFDDLHHEVLHTLGACTDDDPDCPWRDDDDEA